MKIVTDATHPVWSENRIFCSLRSASVRPVLAIMGYRDAESLGSIPVFADRRRRKVKILERAETMGDVPHAPNGFGKTLRVQFWTV